MPDRKRELAAWGRRQLADHPELLETLRGAVRQAASDAMHAFDETRRRQQLRSENIDDFDAEFPPEDRDPPVVFVPADMKCASPADHLSLMASVLDRYSPKPLVAPWGVEGDSPAITSDAHSMWYWHLWDAVGEWELDDTDSAILRETVAKARQDGGCAVTLAQAAALVNRSKRTLEKHKTDADFPAPIVRGGDGKPAEWRWDDIRPWLERRYNRKLPEHFPADQFIRR